MLHKIASACIAAVMLFSACIKDEIKSSYTYYRPVYKTKATVRSEVKSSAPLAIVHPGKVYYKDGYVFLNELEKGIHVIDIKNPAKPVVVSFIAIPGCIDMAVRGNILYADLSTDLIAINIANPTQVQVTTVLEGVFPHRYYAGYFQNDTSQVIVDWVRVDTTVWDSEPFSWGLKSTDMVPMFNSSSDAGKVANGIGGSMARFALYSDRLYTVSHSDLKVFNTAQPDKPAYLKQVNLHAGDIETIFPYGTNLFLGSQTGMYIYSVQNKDNPVLYSKFTHARVCDPVVANNKYAYVTLRNGVRCGGFTNQLEVIHIENLLAPTLIKTYSLTHPHGLSIDGNTLLICDGSDGLKVFDASLPDHIRQVGHVAGISTFDVIALNGLALVVGEKGLYVVDYANPAEPKILSAITIGK